MVISYARNGVRQILRDEGGKSDRLLEGRAAFFNDHKTQDAVIRNLEVIGQAVKDLGTERLSAEQPSIPWTQIAGARNVLAHQYLGVDLNLVWNIVEQNLPALKAAIHETAAHLAISLPGRSGQQ